MQVKRFVAEDMRTAMRGVKEELGADAVILSNRVVDGQVEILAARDYDENLINNALNRSLVDAPAESAAAYYEKRAAQRELERGQQTAGQSPDQPAQQSSDSQAATTSSAAAADDIPWQTRASRQNESKAGIDEQGSTESIDALYDNVSDVAYPQDNNRGVNASISAMGYAQHQAAGLASATSSTPQSEFMTAMHNELKSLRAMIENQQVLGEWQTMIKEHPIRVSLYRRLTELGLSQEVCKYLAKGLDNSADVESALQAALKQLVHQLPISTDDILNNGGVFAMIGPTGVGKTTTIAKLAARFAMQHGQRHVALISTDTYRIGAHEQLVTYGRLLGVSVYSANDTDELQQLLHKLHDKKLVLIDTAGMSQRDLGISQAFSQLRHPSMMIKPYLVLSANAQLSTLDEVINAFQVARPAGCILTKLDEAASVGGILSALVKHHLPAAYTSHGQKVPEDLQPARARELVELAIKQAARHREAVDEEFMAAAFSARSSDLRM